MVYHHFHLSLLAMVCALSFTLASCQSKGEESSASDKVNVTTTGKGFEVSAYDSIIVAAPFKMPAIALYHFPKQDFTITEFGATLLDKGLTEEACVEKNTLAIGRAMQACHDAGGGRVVIPAGEWHTGPIHFLSGCNLYLSEGAKVIFSDNPEDYLPAVKTSWEGLECMNYSPLVYAYQYSC